MSSSPSEAENAAPTASVMHEQGHEISPGGDQNKSTRWTPTSRTNSTSLLTQALAAQKDAQKIPAPSITNYDSPEASASPQQLSTFETTENQPYDGVNPSEEARSPQGKMAMVAPGVLRDAQGAKDIGSTPTTRSSPLTSNDISQVDTILSRHRHTLSSSRGRGTSLERTEKEKRVQDSPKGTYSTNPGDTALPPSPAPASPTTSDPISSNQPTEGVRAKYRQWRDSRPGTAAEKAWSIGEDVADDSLGGQVEKSIKDAMAGIEPNNRSRKASHSLRFFKEGLPEDKTKKREGKSRGRSKEGSSSVKSSPVSEKPKQWTPQERETSIGSLNKQNLFVAGQSPLSSPQDGAIPTSKLASRQAGLNPNSKSLPAEEEYFETLHDIDVASDDQLKTMPSALLDEIRKHHNLTPGAAKGSSFSRSIPVTESERRKSDTNDQTPILIEDNQQDDDSSAERGDFHRLSHVKNTDEEDESGEEQISSALFVPHKTPHESPERKRDPSQSATRPRLNDPEHSKDSTSQEWLEEYEVPSRDLDKNYVSQEPEKRSLPSPTYVEKESLLEEPHSNFGVDQGDATNGEESRVTDDIELTPTGSLKQDTVTSPPQHIHTHQQISRQPLEAVELIPYRHQVGGHTTMWRFSKRAVCKQLNNRENEFYEKIERYHPQLLKFLPRYIGVLNVTLKQTRRKATRKDLADASSERQDATQGGDVGNSTSLRTGFSNGWSSKEPEQGRVISQSMQSASVPIPTVTFADNRHIIPKSLQPHPHLIDSQRSKSDTASLLRARAGSGQVRSSHLNGDVKYRPTLSDKHAVSWGATTVNKQLRNQVFDEAFLDQPIPVYPHKKPANQNRSLPIRNGGSNLRTSNSESSLKAAQQSQAASSSQPAEQSIRRRAIKAAAERRNGAPLTSTEPGLNYDVGATDEETEAEFSKKSGTSAPEPDIARSPNGKRQRRYSSGGLRRKPAEVQEDRGNLKYFEEADDVGYKADAEEDVFSMDPESPSDKFPSSAATKQGSGPLYENTDDDWSVAGSEISKTSSHGPTVSAGPVEATSIVDLPRPVNPKEAQTQPDSRVEYFLLLEDLTTGMKRPCIMDLKMGTRQYGVQANEKKQKSQRRKCADTTSKELGVRVCGLQVWDVKEQKYIFLDKYFGRDLKTGRPFQDALKRFLYDGVDYSSVLRHIPTILKKLSQLELLIQGLAGYRFYAASLLLFYDGDTQEEDESDSAASGMEQGMKHEIDFKIADFANCVTKEDVISHETPCPPHHPDLPDNGFLRGLRSLRRYFLAIQHECKREMGWEGMAVNDEMEENEDERFMSY